MFDFCHSFDMHSHKKFLPFDILSYLHTLDICVSYNLLSQAFLDAYSCCGFPLFEVFINLVQFTSDMCFYIKLIQVNFV